MKTILMTGAAGGIGTYLRPELRGKYALRLSDRVPVADLRDDESFVAAELSDLDALRRAAEGVDGTLMGSVSFETLSRDRLLINGFITSQRPFLRYDRELGRYVVDREAKEQNRYLSQEEQVALPVNNIL